MLGADNGIREDWAMLRQPVHNQAMDRLLSPNELILRKACALANSKTGDQFLFGDDFAHQDFFSGIESKCATVMKVEAYEAEQIDQLDNYTKLVAQGLLNWANSVPGNGSYIVRKVVIDRSADAAYTPDGGKTYISSFQSNSVLFRVEFYITALSSPDNSLAESSTLPPVEIFDPSFFPGDCNDH